MPSLDVVIVNWNAGEQLRRCLESIAAARRDGFALARVAVVDNASADGSCEGLGNLSLPLAILRNDRNAGFAAACNRGAAGSAAEYLLFLNPDTRLYPGSLARPVAFMESPEGAATGIVGIRLVDERGETSRSCARFPTLATMLSKALGLRRLSPRLFPSYAMTEWDHAESRDVDYVTGAFFLVRRSLFAELGGFDERFFVYLEETDFARRARSLGRTCRYLADARAFHRGGGTSERANAERLFYAASSRLLYARKHFGAGAAFLYLAASAILEPAIRVAAAARPGGRIREVARAYRLYWRSLPRLLEGRSVDEPPA